MVITRLAASVLLVAWLACAKDSPAESERPAVVDTTAPASNDTPEPPPRELDRGCATDEECVPAPACCPEPCTALVINRRDLPGARAALARCPKDERCPEAGDCAEHAYLCVRGTCELVMSNSPDFRPRQ